MNIKIAIKIRPGAVPAPTFNNAVAIKWGKNCSTICIPAGFLKGFGRCLPPKMRPKIEQMPKKRAFDPDLDFTLNFH